MFWFVTRNIQNAQSTLSETHKPAPSGAYTLLQRVSQQDFGRGTSNEDSLWRWVQDCHGSHPRAVVTQTTKERAEKASVFNCDIKISPKATTHLETTLWVGKQFCVGWTSQMLSGSRVLACYMLATQQVSVVQTPENPRKSETLSVTAFFPVQLKPGTPSVYKLL